MSTHLIIPDIHAKPDTDHSRADWIGELIKEVKPDVVINGGDMWDMDSLNNFDKGKASFYGKRYKNDIEAGLEFDERLWAPMKRAKKKRPLRVFLEGNHEHRIKRLLEHEHNLEGTVGFSDLRLQDNYDIVCEYNGATPGVVNIDGVNYAHYFVSGVMGNAISGINQGRIMLQKKHESCTAFHSHIYDYAIEPKASGGVIMGLVAGVGHTRKPEYAGVTADMWFPAVTIKTNVENGMYNLQFIRFDDLERKYGKRRN